MPQKITMALPSPPQKRWSGEARLPLLSAGSNGASAGKCQGNLAESWDFPHCLEVIRPPPLISSGIIWGEGTRHPCASPSGWYQWAMSETCQYRRFKRDPELPQGNTQNVQVLPGNRSSYQEPGKPQLNEKRTNIRWHQNDTLELSGKDFKTAILKMFHWAVTNLL